MSPEDKISKIEQVFEEWETDKLSNTGLIIRVHGILRCV